MLSDKEMADFKTWLVCCGAIVDAPTNKWEILRVRTCFGPLVAYTNAKGRESWPEDLLTILNRYKLGQPMALSTSLRSKVRVRHKIEALAQRDGMECWFCGAAFNGAEDSRITIEHLVPKAHGGPDHASNLVLACKACNTEAGNRSVAEKVLIRERRRDLICREVEANDAAA